MAPQRARPLLNPPFICPPVDCNTALACLPKGNRQTERGHQRATGREKHNQSVTTGIPNRPAHNTHNKDSICGIVQYCHNRNIAQRSDNETSLYLFFKEYKIPVKGLASLDSELHLNTSSILHPILHQEMFFSD